MRVFKIFSKIYPQVVHLTYNYLCVGFTYIILVGVTGFEPVTFAM